MNSEWPHRCDDPIEGARRPFQFTLRTAMTVMTACCLLFAFIGSFGLVPLIMLVIALHALAVVISIAWLFTQPITQLLNRFEVRESTIVHGTLAALVFIGVAAWIMLMFARPN